MAAKSWEVEWSPHNPDEFIRYCNDIFLYRIIRDEVSNPIFSSFGFCLSQSMFLILNLFCLGPIKLLCTCKCVYLQKSGEAGIMLF